MAHSPLAPHLRGLLLAIALVSGLQLLVPGLNEPMIGALALHPFSDGRLVPWRIIGFITYPFVHGSVLHLALNCLWLVLIGQFVALFLRPLPFLAVFFAGAIAGGVAQLALAPEAWLIGASGGVFALMGAFGRIQLLFEGRGRAAAARRRELSRFVVMMSLMIVLFSLPGISPGGAPISWSAHLGGLLAGVLLLPWAMRRSQGAADARAWAGASRSEPYQED